jgi:hypothetical protein
MNQFTFTTGYACYGSDITVTIAVDGHDLSIVSAVQDGVAFDPAVIGEEYDCPVSVLLLEAAGDYAHDKGLYEEPDAYVPERKHWEVREDRINNY